MDIVDDFDTRRLLQLALGLIFLAILGMGGLIIHTLLKPPAQSTVSKIIESDASQSKVESPWAKQTKTAKELVMGQRVTVPAPRDAQGKPQGEPSQTTVDAALQQPTFAKQVLNIQSAKPKGWRSTWWGETKYGPSFYLVQFVFEDAHIKVGPQWLVDLKSAKIIPKNALARVVMSASTRKNEKYFDRHEQVVSALANHRFDTGISLGGALLMYFETREASADGDKILGWTIEHSHGPMFRAFFQWVEGGEPTYAEFEFDYDKRALKAINFQAASVMRVGDEFDRNKKRADIYPNSYDPKAKNPRKRWLGPSRGACASREMRDTCGSLATILESSQTIESLSWLLTAKANNAAQFSSCKKARKCSWKMDQKAGTKAADRVFLVTYRFQLKGKKKRQTSWEVDLKKKKVTPLDRVSTASWLAAHPRG